jgi:anion-transporting  ArsA/GET3 family ATPase
MSSTPAGPSAEASAELRELLGSRLVLITGKGGTGKTTYSAALAAVSAARGRKTLLIEIDSQRSAFRAVFETERRPAVDIGHTPRRVAKNLDVSNLSWQEALTTFVTSLVPSRRVVSLVLQNKIVGRFIDFTPGSQEIVILSALVDQLGKYDVVVADLPATGHAFSLLDVTRSALGLFRSGPVRARATELRAVLHAPTTRVVLVALPEEMVVNETIETCDRLARFELLSQPPLVFLNRATLPTLTDAERELIRRIHEQPLDPIQAEFVRAGRWEDELEQGTAEASRRLTEGLHRSVILVPPAPAGGSPAAVVESVSAHLGRMVGLTRRDLPWT